MGLIVPKPYAELLKKAHEEGKSIQGSDIMAKIKDSLAAWKKLLAELRR